MRLGFIGTGGITAAIITGLCTGQDIPEEIWVSIRSVSKSKELEKTFKPVHVADINQAVVDNADMVFLAFLPGQEKDILSTLKFREEQTIVTLLAGIPISAVRPLTAPAREVVRAVPLPCTALRTGPVVMYPDQTKARDIFSRVGSVIVPEAETDLETFAVITALMAPFYELVDTVAAWGETNRLAREQAAAYTGAMFKALALIAENAPNGDIQILVRESMTPGGLNETAMKRINDRGGFSLVTEALDDVVCQIKT